MRSTLLQLTLAVVAVCGFTGGDWLQFRGNDGTSTSPQTSLPLTFDEKTNVAWKVPLPGRGPSSPIVVQGRVVVTASSGPKGDRLHVLCFDAESGKLRWHRQLWATGHTACHPFAAVATCTPASDGERIFAFYSSNDLACFDLDGNLKWFRGLAYEHREARNDAGMGSSPIVSGDTVIVQIENQGDSFAAGIDTATGGTRWLIEREPDAIWSSPSLLRGKTPAEDVVVMHSRSRLTGHNAQTGKFLWDYEASCHTIASATTCGNRIYLPSFGLHALQYDATQQTIELLWYEPRLRSGNASPVVYDGRIYTIKPPAILACGDARDGSVLWQLRLKGPQWATPVLAGGHLYVVNHPGLVQIVELGDEGKLVGSVQIDPAILASPAVADGAIYFRSDQHLLKVAFDH